MIRGLVGLAKLLFSRDVVWAAREYGRAIDEVEGGNLEAANKHLSIGRKYHGKGVESLYIDKVTDDYIVIKGVPRDLKNRRRRTSKLEIDLQHGNIPIHTDIPVYISFKDIEEGPAILIGTNRRNFKRRLGMLHSFGEITDKNRVKMNYEPQYTDNKIEMKYLNDKLKELPIDSQVWLYGECYATLLVSDCGNGEFSSKRTEFKSSNKYN